MSVLEDLFIYLEEYPENSVNPAAAEDEISAMEQSMAGIMPEEVKKFYRWSNGANLFSGSLSIYPLSGVDLSIRNAGRIHKALGWAIPDEVIVFGDNGAGELYGYWVNSHGIAVILQIAEIKGPGCMSIVATSFERFLFMQALLLSYADGSQVLIKKLPLPEDQKKAKYSEDDITDLLLWIDPVRPQIPYDPYEAALDLDKIKSMLESSGLSA